MNRLHFKSALLPSGWAHDVAIDVDSQGNISAIETGVAAAVDGCLIPGLANLHSHAHQRAMAGLAERSGDSSDSFWTWRKIMYQFLDRIQPRQLHAIACQLYLEMLKAGYTRVAEFQYLHHQSDGSHYDNIAEMSMQTLFAACEVGLGITNLPVHYQYGGFGGQPISNQQHRFASDPTDCLKIIEALQLAGRENANVVTGVAAHSLRAVTRESFSELLSALNPAGALPTHIHIAEQAREVEDCVSWSGARPVEYLYDNFEVDESWCLIHATHLTDNETTLLAQSGAIAGLCPSTEGNLGDGFFNATRFLAEGGVFGIGSDSHISVSPTEELRWFEYGQRLLHRTRNQLAGGNNRSTGRNLLDLALAGGARACGHNSGAIAIGKRADLVVLDTRHALLCEREQDDIIDSWIFSGNQNTVRDVYVGGKQVISDGHHQQEASIGNAFQLTLQELRGSL